MLVRVNEWPITSLMVHSLAISNKGFLKDFDGGIA